MCLGKVPDTRSGLQTPGFPLASGHGHSGLTSLDQEDSGIGCLQILWTFYHRSQSWPKTQPHRVSRSLQSPELGPVPMALRCLWDIRAGLRSSSLSPVTSGYFLPPPTPPGFQCMQEPRDWGSMAAPCCLLLEPCEPRFHIRVKAVTPADLGWPEPGCLLQWPCGGSESMLTVQVLWERGFSPQFLRPLFPQFSSLWPLQTTCWVWPPWGRGRWRQPVAHSGLVFG